MQGHIFTFTNFQVTYIYVCILTNIHLCVYIYTYVRVCVCVYTYMKLTYSKANEETEKVSSRPPCFHVAFK